MAEEKIKLKNLIDEQETKMEEVQEYEDVEQKVSAPEYNDANEVTAMENMTNEEIEQLIEQNFKSATQNDVDLDGKISTKEKADRSGIKARAKKMLKGAGKVLVGATILGVIVGSPIFGIVGALAIKYNKPIMEIASIFGQKPLLIPDLTNHK